MLTLQVCGVLVCVLVISTCHASKPKQQRRNAENPENLQLEAQLKRVKRIHAEPEPALHRVKRVGEPELMRVKRLRRDLETVARPLQIIRRHKRSSGRNRFQMKLNKIDLVEKALSRMKRNRDIDKTLFRTKRTVKKERQIKDVKRHAELATIRSRRARRRFLREKELQIATRRMKRHLKNPSLSHHKMADGKPHIARNAARVHTRAHLQTLHKQMKKGHAHTKPTRDQKNKRMQKLLQMKHHGKLARKHNHNI